MYVRPKRNPCIPEYLSKLTGIDDEILAEKGMGFPEAYDRFKEFAGGMECYANWFNEHDDPIADGNVMRLTLSLYRDLPDPDEPKYRNIGAWLYSEFARRGLATEGKETTGLLKSGELASYFGAEEELASLGVGKHNALYDVHSILVALRKLGFRQAAR
jgi:hypothetical protein